MPDPVEVTRDLIRMDTVNPPGNEEPAARYLGEMLAEAGLTVSYPRLGDNSTGLIAHAPGKPSRLPLVFTGHLDTVPVGDAPWNFPPHGAEIQEGRLIGRGASDMKSGVAAMAACALQLARKPELKNDIVFVFTAGEETGSEGAFQMRDSGVLPRKAGAIVVAEPTGNIPLLGHKGALWLECTAKGKSAHGSMPDLGENAIYKAAPAAAGLEDFFSSAASHPQLGKPTVNVGTFQGGSKINMVPDSACFRVDLRSVPGVEHDVLMEEIKAKLGSDIEIKRLIDLPGISTAPDDPWIARVLDIMARVEGTRPEPGYVNYFTDASVLTSAMNNPPTLILGPGEPSQAHQTNEYCVVEKIGRAAEFYLEIALDWLKP
ncbi:MAG: M20 family metallopeptidase [Deltaproteobacteria bacterium]|nr:M20 family metallopeptidase [Deltaproteobacteria bacterium]